MYWLLAGGLVVFFLARSGKEGGGPPSGPDDESVPATDRSDTPAEPPLPRSEVADPEEAGTRIGGAGRRGMCRARDATVSPPLEWTYPCGEDAQRYRPVVASTTESSGGAPVYLGGG